MQIAWKVPNHFYGCAISLATIDRNSDQCHMNPGLHAFWKWQMFTLEESNAFIFHIQLLDRNHKIILTSGAHGFSTFLCKAALEKSRAVLYLVTGVTLNRLQLHLKYCNLYGSLVNLIVLNLLLSSCSFCSRFNTSI